MVDIYKEFRSVYEKSLTGCDLSKIPKKYLNTEKMYRRFLPVIQTLVKTGMTKGVDFGCGTAAATILGGLFGIQITGIDIPTWSGHAQSLSEYVQSVPENRLEQILFLKQFRDQNKQVLDGPNPYFPIYTNLQNVGYPILVLDTSKYPWEIEDDSFQFLLGYCSIAKDSSSSATFISQLCDSYKLYEQEWIKNNQQAKWLNNRLRELIRISKKNSVWFLNNTSVTFVMKNKVFDSNSKEIVLKKWPEK